MCVKCGDMYHVGKDGSEATGSLGSAFGGAAALPTYTIPQAADYLINGFWEQRGFSGAKFNVKAGGTLTYSVAGLDPEGAWFAKKALEAWSIVSGIKFVSGAASSADLVFRQDNPSGNGAYAWSDINGSGHITRSYVNVSTDWYRGDEGKIDSYSYQTYVHEIGHALGLGHAGNYNGSASFGRDAHYANESWQMSVMSYFSQTENPNIDASFAFLLGPMAADIYAIQKMYGKSTTSNVGNTTWGYNSNAQGSYSEFTSLAGGRATVAMTVFDSGGEDTFDFSRSGRNQKIDLRQGKFSDVLGHKGNVGIALGTTIENAKGGSGNDVLIGNAVGNTLEGNGGNDHLYGGSGADRLYGGSGADRLYGGLGADRLHGGLGADHLDGGAGFDIATYVGAYKDLIVNLGSGFTSGPAAAGDTFTSIEGVFGGRGNDRLIGNGAANTLDGGRGNDFLLGAGGHDRLQGGDGNDVLNGGLGRDMLFGGAGFDLADYRYATAKVHVDLLQKTSWGAAWGDKFFGIEGVVGGTVSDTLKGTNGANKFHGRQGNDTLIGRGGNDVLFGNKGADTLRGGAGADRLYGNEGNDVLNGGLGRDMLFGGAGFDLADYRYATAKVHVDLLQKTSWGAAWGDKFFGIEGVVGGTVSDTLKGTNGANKFYGRQGNDTLIGRGGNDVLFGNKGADTLRGGAGADRLHGNEGNDVLFGGLGKDRFYYDDGRDVIKDFRAGQNDRIFIDRDDVPKGMTVRKMLQNKAKVIKGDVHVDFGNGNKLIIEDVSNKMSLADDIQFY